MSDHQEKKLESMIVESAATYMYSEECAEHINKCAKRMVNDVVESQFRWSSPIKKQLEEYLNEKLIFDPTTLSIETYNAILSNALSETITDALNGNAFEATQAILRNADFKLAKCYSLCEFIDHLIETSKEEFEEREDRYQLNEDVRAEVSVRHNESVTDWGSQWQYCTIRLTLPVAENDANDYEFKLSRFSHNSQNIEKEKWTINSSFHLEKNNVPIGSDKIQNMLNFAYFKRVEFTGVEDFSECDLSDPTYYLEY